MTFIERLSNLKTNQATGCWEFQGYCVNGYGRLSREGKRVYAHRAVWEIVFGEIPPVLCVLHTCDNPPCCNPAHLWLGTHAENMEDKQAKGRGNQPHGETNGQAKLTEPEVREIRHRYAAGDLGRFHKNTSYFNGMRTGKQNFDKGSRSLKANASGAHKPGVLSTSTDFKFALPDWPYDFWPLSPVAGAAFDQFTEDKFITTKMLTVSPVSPSTDLIYFETRIYEAISSYEVANGGPLRCDGYASRGKSGIGRLEAHLVFQKAPNMVLLKRLMRKIGSVRVTGEYDAAEDWTKLSQEFKNHPPHTGCTHYTAQHSDHPDNRRIWNLGETVAPAEQDSVQNQRDAEFQRELDDAVWLGQNNRPRLKTALRGGLEAGERRVVRGYIVRTLPKSKSNQLPERARVALRKGKFNDTRRRR